MIVRVFPGSMCPLKSNNIWMVFPLSISDGVEVYWMTDWSFAVKATEISMLLTKEL